MLFSLEIVVREHDALATMAAVVPENWETILSLGKRRIPEGAGGRIERNHGYSLQGLRSSLVVLLLEGPLTTHDRTPLHQQV